MPALTISTRLLFKTSKTHLKLICCFHNLTSRKFTSLIQNQPRVLASSDRTFVYKYLTASVYLSLRKLTTTLKFSSFWKDRKSDNELQNLNNSQTSHDGKSLVDRYIFVHTLINYYEDIPNGVILDTAYADSRPGEEYERHMPVVLGLHDTPGTHHDLLSILGTFAKLGCRTIAPTFPGHGETRNLLRGLDNVFCHSTMERAIFINDFINELGIERVDMIVAVGASCYPALRLCSGADSSKMYRSLALISPWPLSKLRYETNTELSRAIQFLWDRPFLRPPAKLLLPAYKLGKTQTVREKVTTAYLLNNLDLAEASGFALAIGILNVPRFVVFGELDHVVEKNVYYEIIDKLEIPHPNISTFKGKLVSPLFPGALVFPEEGYDLHQKHSGFLSMCLLNLLKLFHPQIQL